MKIFPDLQAAHLIDRLERLSRASADGHNLNPAQWQALRYLSRANRFSRTPAALADFLSSTRGTVSQTLIALEEKGVIVRTANSKDRRVVDLALTEAGRAALASDPLQLLGQDLAQAAGRDLARLVEILEQTVGARLRRSGGRAFGACYTCVHFRRDVAPRNSAAPHRCELLDEPLSGSDSLSICAEQTS